MAWVWSDELARFAIGEMGRPAAGLTILTAQLACYNIEDGAELGSKIDELLGEDDEEPPLALVA